MNRIDAAFSGLSGKNGRKALIAYLTVGFPSVRALPEIVRLLVDEGVDLVELGIPFSDPLADGPTIQAASQWALEHRVTVRGVFDAVGGIRRRHQDLPLVLMTYYNPVSRFGVKEFCRESARRQVDGVIVPDLPPEEAGDLLRAARPARIDTIFLAAPTSPDSRLRRIVRASTGFIYYVSLTGVTGARASLPPEIKAHVRSIKRLTDLPVCVGFGISGPDQVRQVAAVADGAIIGSALLNVIGESRGKGFSRVAAFVRRLRSACHA
ncbi:MAG: tryptophan synthase subunit alpha [Candidatus Omnitrophica bacterium]|nr:tryptophan synthase subunit alpha [Candidatus Omnitrophota bacterium]